MPTIECRAQQKVSVMPSKLSGTRSYGRLRGRGLVQCEVGTGFRLERPSVARESLQGCTTERVPSRRCGFKFRFDPPKSFCPVL